MNTVSHLAVSCRDWRWLPRMRATNQDGAWVVLGIKQHGRLHLVNEDGDEQLLTFVNDCGLLPDLSDGSTIGLLEHVLLPEVWPDHSINVHRGLRAGGPGHSVSICSRFGDVAWHSGWTDGLSIGETLVHALIAAPAKDMITPSVGSSFRSVENPNHGNHGDDIIASPERSHPHIREWVDQASGVHHVRFERQWPPPKHGVDIVSASSLGVVAYDSNQDAIRADTDVVLAAIFRHAKIVDALEHVLRAAEADQAGSPVSFATAKCIREAFGEALS